MLNWEGNRLGQEMYTHKPVSPLMRSEVVVVVAYVVFVY